MNIKSEIQQILNENEKNEIIEKIEWILQCYDEKYIQGKMIQKVVKMSKIIIEVINKLLEYINNLLNTEKYLIQLS